MATPHRRTSRALSSRQLDSRATDTRLLAAGQVIEEVDESGATIETFAINNSWTEVERSGPMIAVRSARNISIQDKALQLWAQALAVFLPAGYPHTVTEDYLEYQIYDSLQAFCSSIAGLLSSRAVLEGVGVGDASASVTTALLLSAVQESVGRIATILFAHRLGTSLEPECKCYRLAADFFNDAAMVFDCLSPAFPKTVRVCILSASSVLRSLCGIAAGSAKASLSAHFAKKGNLGEVNAKDSSQETVISLGGMLAGTLVVSVVTSTWATWICLTFLLASHLFLNYRAVRAVRMLTLNRQRANIALSSLFHQIASSQKRLVACPPSLASRHESVFEISGALRLFSLTTSMPTGHSVRYGTATFDVPFSRLVAAVQRSGCSMSDIVGAFGGQHFVLWFDTLARQALICVKEGAGPKDLIKAWAVAMQVSVLAAASAEEKGERLSPVDAFMMHVDALSRVHEDWRRMLDGLATSGWDLTVNSLETGKARRLKFRKEE